MRTSIVRHAGLCRVAFGLSARRVQPASRVLSSAATTTRSAQSNVSRFHPSAQLARFYSAGASEADAESLEDSGLVTKFADMSKLGVHEKIIEAIVDGMKYQDMTSVQSMTIEPALKGKDLVAQAKTGTGKTLGFLVPILQRIVVQDPNIVDRFRARADSRDIRAIIVSPTRELAEQIGEEARKLVRNTGIVIQTAVGGTQKRMMLAKCQREGCHVMVGTPGRLNDLLSDPSSGIEAPNLQALVLDEADRMLEVGFNQELTEILESLPDRRDVPRQTLLFSATIPKNVVGLARNFIDPKNFQFVQTISENETPTHEKVPQYIVPCKGFANIFPTLLELAEREIQNAKSNPDALPFKAMVFLPTTAAVRMASFMFRRLAYQNRNMPPVSDIHSKLDQRVRTRVADAFRTAKSAILFTSDVTARGMDFPNVSHVIQIHNPPEREQYIHRLGRTGRAGKEGQGWLLITDPEVRGARRTLTDLPIKRSTDLECASFDLESDGPQPKQFEEVAEACKKVPYEIFDEVYGSFLGSAFASCDMQEIVDSINTTALRQWGLPQTPAVSPSRMRSIGSLQGLRVARHDSGGRGRDGDFGGGRSGGFGGGRGGGFGGGRGGYGRDSRASRDPFGSMDSAHSGDRDRGGRSSYGSRSSF